MCDSSSLCCQQSLEDLLDRVLVYHQRCVEDLAKENQILRGNLGDVAAEKEGSECKVRFPGPCEVAFVSTCLPIEPGFSDEPIPSESAFQEPQEDGNRSKAQVGIDVAKDEVERCLSKPQVRFEVAEDEVVHYVSEIQTRPSATSMKSRIEEMVKTHILTNSSKSFDRADSPEQWSNMTWCQLLAAFLESEFFEMFVSVIIIINTICMAVEMQYNGLQVGYKVGFKGHSKSVSETWPGADEVFKYLEYVFITFFTLELSIRLAILRAALFRKAVNWLDIFVVATGLLGLVPGTSTDSLNTTYARLVRLGKLSRGFKLLHLTKMVDSLHLLLKSLGASLGALFWSLSLLLVVQCVAGMVIGQLVRNYISDEEHDIDKRHLVYTYYGTFTRSMFTMFEVTMANWAPACRVLTNNVGEEYATFFLVYRCLVGFCVLNVISAVFVQQTIKVANADQEIMILNRKRAAEDYTRKLQKLFEALDTSGDGYLSYDEFNEVMKQPSLKVFLQALEIDPHDLEGLFHLIDDGDGQISIDEFILGATRIKGNAKSIDIAHMMAQVKRLTKKLERLSRAIGIKCDFEAKGSVISAEKVRNV